METQAARRSWLKVLANAAPNDLEDFWRRFDTQHSFQKLRHPESGLAMVRGRADGSGRPFNLGETTISRCVIVTNDSKDGSEITGVGYVLGRDKRHAELTACFDALFQDSGSGPDARATVLPPLSDKQEKASEAASRKTDSTRVEFFTMVRGE